MAYEPSRIMVVGETVAIVQLVSRYCLAQGADVLPFYGLPDAAAIVLFDPHVLVLCLPVASEFLAQIAHPYLLWETLPLDAIAGGESVSTPTALAHQLQAILGESAEVSQPA